MDIGQVLGIFIGWPVAALIPAALFSWFYWRYKSPRALLAAVAWLAYCPYELGMKMRVLCSGECNIRVDLLLFYPILLVLTWMAISAIRRARRKADEDS